LTVSNVLEHAIEVAPGNEVGHGGGGQIPGIVQPRFMDHDEPVYVFVRQRFQQPLADQTENRGVDADAQRQRENSHGGKAPVARQHAGTIAEIPAQGFDPPEQIHVARALFVQGGIAELTRGERPRLVLGHPLLYQFVDALVEVEFNLFRDPLGDLLPAEDIGETREPGHRDHASRRTRATPLVSRVQLSRSRTSCSSPAGVSA
jgi:hypothetical protein